MAGAESVRPVESPGLMSYTVICDGCLQLGDDKMIVSFREPGGILDDDMVRLAKEIHGGIVPECTYQGYIDGVDPPFAIYCMSYLRGSQCIEVMYYQWVELEAEEAANHGVFIKDLARYFSRCWSNPQPIGPLSQLAQQDGIRRRLVLLMEQSPPIVSKSKIMTLIDTIPLLFNEDYPQVLTHGDFTGENILIDEESFKITGIIDWPLAAVMPFGMDLDILFRSTGFANLNDWYEYTCKTKLKNIFWDEFWAASGVEGEETRRQIQSMAEAVAQISALLRVAFWRKPNGSISEVIQVSQLGVKQLAAWFGEGEGTPTDL